MAHEHFDIEPEDGAALRDAARALLRAVEAASPNPDAVAAATERVRQTLGQNDYRLVNDVDTTSPLSPATPPSHATPTVDASMQTASPDTAATWPPMTINHGKVNSSRLFRSKTVTKVILISLLWNQDREVDKDDLLESFRIQKLEIRPATLLSRISKMRSERLIARRDADSGESLGVYRLTEAGRVAARKAAIQLNAVPPDGDSRG